VPNVSAADSRSAHHRLPKVVLFDMDDTIFDHSLTCRAALGQLRREESFLRGRPLDDLWKEYNRLLGVTHLPVMLGQRPGDEARTDRFARLATWCGHPVDRSAATALSRRYRDHYQRLRRPVPGAPEFVRSLPGRTQIGIVTDNTVAEQTEKIAFLGLEGTIDFLVTSEEIGVGKPDSAMFRAALERAEASAAEAVMIGDRWEFDIVGARGVGMPALWFNRFRAPRPGAIEVPEFASYRSPLRLERLLASPAVAR
jgi:HAD superfamily hydrolase (TIGR01549 family)